MDNLTALSGWGCHPVQNAQVYFPISESHVEKNFMGIARGMGRSYGDSALSEKIISTRYLNLFIDFDETSGVLYLGSGITLKEVLELIIPKGWFLPVTPGTQYVSVGGAIASDVHGKNHHVHGCFSEYVKSIMLLLGNGEIIECSRDNHTDLFKATCGGMGLTGIILAATIQLKPIQSPLMQVTTLKTTSLEETLHLFDEHVAATYSVAWIDCLNRGRSHVILGEHHSSGALTMQDTSAWTMPCRVSLLNDFSIKIFNAWYYKRNVRNETTHYTSFFYPLDKIKNWNKLYGKKGFTQYQCVIPKAAGAAGLKELLNKMTQAKRNSFLAVLKMFGKQNQNYLSFPTEGYALALDFKIDSGLFEFLNELDSIVLHHGGRLYLTKDCRMSEEMFKQSYPHWEIFQSIREKYAALDKFQSLQSRRIGL